MDWHDAKLTIESMRLPSAQNANALELISVVEGLQPPQEISLSGYDGGLSLHWNGCEVSAYGDRYETYLFSDGDTRISHWPHAPTDPFDPALIAELQHAVS